MLSIAVKMLLGDRVKYLGVIFGVLFATFLISLLLCMFAGIMARTYALVSDTPTADVWVMDAAVEQAEDVVAMPSTALDRVRSVSGVAWAARLYTGALRARLFDGRFRTVAVMGVDAATLLGGPGQMLRGDVTDLRLPDAVIVDEYSARVFLSRPLTDAEVEAARREGPKTELGSPVRVGTGRVRPLSVGDELLINDRRLKVVGVCRSTPRFNARPVLYTTYERAMQIAPPERNLLSFVLAGAQPGEDAAALARRISEQTGLRARTSKQFVADTFWFFIKNTDIVAHVGMMVGIGALVGFAITGLMLYLFTSENLRYYATLKAMGMADWKLGIMVLGQSLLAGVVGYGLGIGACAGIGMLMLAHEMPFEMPWIVPVIVGALNLALCTASAWLSTAKVRRLEPGVVFR